jgi:hypothetical protein
VTTKAVAAQGRGPCCPQVCSNIGLFLESHHGKSICRCAIGRRSYSRKRLLGRSDRHLQGTAVLSFPVHPPRHSTLTKRCAALDADLATTQADPRAACTSPAGVPGDSKSRDLLHGLTLICVPKVLVHLRPTARARPQTRLLSLSSATGNCLK